MILKERVYEEDEAPGENVNEELKLCCFCGETATDFELLYELPCSCNEFSHERCLEKHRKRFCVGFYFKNFNLNSKNLFLSELFCGITHFLVFSIHRINHHEWFHPYLPYNRCSKCDRSYGVDSRYNSEETKFFMGGKLYVLPLVIQLNIVAGLLIFFSFFLAAVYTLEFQFLSLLYVVLFSAFIGIPGHYVIMLLSLNLYNRKLCQAYKLPHMNLTSHCLSHQKLSISEYSMEHLDFEIQCFGACEDVVVRIFSFLSVRELVGDVSFVCRYFHILIDFPRKANLSVKVISRFYGMHNELWKMIFQSSKKKFFPPLPPSQQKQQQKHQNEKSDNNESPKLYLKSVKDEEVVSYKDVYIARLMEHDKYGRCRECYGPITVQQKLDSDCVEKSCHPNRNCGGMYVHRTCHDFRRKLDSNSSGGLNFKINVLKLFKSRLLNLLLRRQVDHYDIVHRDMKYRRCSYCQCNFSLRLKQGSYSCTPFFYAVVSSLGWVIMGGLELAVALGFTHESYVLWKAVWREGWAEGWASTCEEGLGIWSFVKQGVIYRLFPAVLFFSFFSLFVVFWYDAFGVSYNNMMVASYIVERSQKDEESKIN